MAEFIAAFVHQAISVVTTVLLVMNESFCDTYGVKGLLVK